MKNWEKDGLFLKRQYASYEEYTEHQKEKLPLALEWAQERGVDFDARWEKTLLDRLIQTSKIHSVKVPDSNVLCVGARLGGEVRAFNRLGYFAIGVDLNPGDNNPNVIIGDFHKLPFADNSIDLIFTNSIDHAFDISLMFKEINRVTKHDAKIIVEYATTGGPGPYEVTWWDSGDVVKFLKSRKYIIESENDFGLPWTGQQLIISKGQ
jgi:SAM-dependent methyltransferase